MPNSRLAIRVPLLQDGAPHRICGAGKVLTFISLLIGFSFAVLLSSFAVLLRLVPDAERLVAQKPTITMAQNPTITMARTLQQRSFAANPKNFWHSRSPPFRQQILPGHESRNAEVFPAWGPHQVQRRSLRVSAATDPSRDVDKLLNENSGKVEELKMITSGQGEEYDDLWRLRFVLGNPDDFGAAKAAAVSAIRWRKGPGKPIVEAAKLGFSEATKDGGWNNKAAFDRAPYAAAISPYIGPEGSHIFTVPTEWGDLCSVIRAPAIDDNDLMERVTVDQLTEFFVYVKELNAMVCNKRTRESRSLCQIISANDLNGVLRLPNSDFGKALSESSKQSLAMYPLLAGPTILLNLPDFLQVIVDNFFKPLFPKRVAAKIRFESGPLKELPDLKGLRDPVERAKFLNQIEALKPSLTILRIS